MTYSSLFQQWPVPHVSALIINGNAEDAVGEQDRVYELASVTKLLAAYGFLVAYEEGIFELDSPCGPEGSTVRHLLAHASGVGFKKGDKQRPVEEKRVYSSYGFEILADEVSAQAGMSFAEYLQAAVFEPLGMNNSVLWGSPGHEARSTTKDLGLFAHELLNPTLLHEDTVREAMTVQFPELAGIVPGYGNHKPCPWGLGFEIKGKKDPHWTAASMPEDTVGHFGQSGTYLWVHPATQRAVVALTDEPFGEWAKPLWAETNQAVWESMGS